MAVLCIAALSFTLACISVLCRLRIFPCLVIWLIRIAILTTLVAVYTDPTAFTIWCSLLVALAWIANRSWPWRCTGLFIAYFALLVLASFSIPTLDQHFMTTAAGTSSSSMPTAFEAVNVMLSSHSEALVVRSAPRFVTAGELRGVYCNAMMARDVLYTTATWSRVERTVTEQTVAKRSASSTVAQRCVVNATLAAAQDVVAGVSQARVLAVLMHNAQDGLQEWTHAREAARSEMATVLTDSASTLTSEMAKMGQQQQRDWSIFTRHHLMHMDSIPLQLRIYTALRQTVADRVPLAGWAIAWRIAATSSPHSRARAAILDVLELSIEPHLSGYIALRNASSAQHSRPTDVALLELAASWPPTNYAIADAIVHHGIQLPLLKCRHQGACLPAEAAQLVLATWNKNMKHVPKLKQAWLKAGAPIGKWERSIQRGWEAKLAMLERDGIYSGACESPPCA